MLRTLKKAWRSWRHELVAVIEGLVRRILSNRYHVAIKSRVTGVWLAWLLTSTTTWINFLHTTSDASTAMHLYRVLSNIFPIRCK